MAADAAPWETYDKPRGLTFGGRAFATTAPDLGMHGPYEDRFTLRSGIDFRVKYKFAKNARFALGAKFRYVMRHGDRTEHDAWFDLGETYLQFRVKKFTLRAGRYRLGWGRNALLSPLSRLTPVDYTTAFEPGGATEARISVAAVRMNLNLYPVSLELVWIPLYTPARISFYGRDFSVLRPGMLEQTLPALMPTTGAGLIDDELRRATPRLTELITEMDPYARDGIQSYLVPNLPDEVIWNSDIGMRFGATAGPVDVDVVALYYLLDTPELRIADELKDPLLDGRTPTAGEVTRLTNPDAELVTSTYLRSFMAGADVAIAAGGFVVSAEAAFDTTSVQYTRRLEPYRSPMLRYAVALRYNFGTVVAFTAEFGHDVTLRPRQDTFLTRQHELTAAFVGTLRLFRDRLQLTLSASYSVFPRDLYLHPQVVVEVDGGLYATFGVQLFEGFRPDAEPTLDSFLSYQGGIVGWFRGNDYAYGTIEYRF
ncbi:MAG: hypothetical protein GY898_00065 [Proteobacteria bacterium]|nr:hypothetical protein [Pseudomonadota bacterium]